MKKYKHITPYKPNREKYKEEMLNDPYFNTADGTELLKIVPVSNKKKINKFRKIQLCFIP